MQLVWQSSSTKLSKSLAAGEACRIFTVSKQKYLRRLKRLRSTIFNKSPVLNLLGQVVWNSGVESWHTSGICIWHTRSRICFVKSSGKERCCEGLLGVDWWLGEQTIQCKTHCYCHLLHQRWQTHWIFIFPAILGNFSQQTGPYLALATEKKVMATNLRNSIDEAVQSRVGETLQFSYPSASQCKQHYAAHAQLGRERGVRKTPWSYAAQTMIFLFSWSLQAEKVLSCQGQTFDVGIGSWQHPAVFCSWIFVSWRQFMISLSKELLRRMVCRVKCQHSQIIFLQSDPCGFSEGR